MAGTSHCRHELLLIPFNMVCSAWAAIQGDEIGKHNRVFPSAESITAPSLVISCNGARRDRIQPAEHPHSSAAGFHRRRPIHDRVLVALAEKQVIGSASLLGCFASGERCSQLSLIRPSFLITGEVCELSLVRKSDNRDYH